MERYPVTSSNVSSVGYDPTNATLEIEFHSGGIYQYFDVPESVFKELLVAGSVGGYFHAHIKNQYRYAKL